VIRDSTGNLYGTTAGYGTDVGRCQAAFYLGCGVVFRLDAASTYTLLHTFTGQDGAIPFAGVTRNSAGSLFGTTYIGGSIKGNFRALDGCGVVFEVDATGKESVVYTFPSDGKHGESPYYAGVIRDPAGNLYGTTQSGGIANNGVVFNLDQTCKQTVLYAFTGGMEGFSPGGGLVRDSAGNLYGTTTEGWHRPV